MPFLIAVGMVSVVSSLWYNKQTLDKGDPKPQLWGYDSRNVGMFGGAAAVALGLLGGMPLLAAAGVGLATAAFNNKDVVARVETGLRKMVREEIDAGVQARISDVPPAAAVVVNTTPPAANFVGTADAALEHMRRVFEGDLTQAA